MKLLKEYARKRVPSGTPEPAAGERNGSRGRFPVFVIHKHAARRLHYDLRLEMGGVLKSFAVPKGPSLDPSVKRLAMMVEDHPYDYKDFEGVIPKGNYGAGPVIIWDRGYYGAPGAKDRTEEEKMLAAGLKKGNLKFVLAGEKVKGEFALVRTKFEENSWLLLKKRDGGGSGADPLSDDRSVLSGKTIEELAGVYGDGKWRARANARAEEAPAEVKDAPRGPMPHNVRPMLPVPAERPFDDPGWLFEIKWDGFRAIAELDGSAVRLYSRNLLSLAGRFPAVAKELSGFGTKAVLDGEIVAVDASGAPDFQLLQNAGQGPGRLIYYVFDLLYYRGRDLTSLPLLKRKEALAKMLPRAAHVRFSDHVMKDGISFFKAAAAKGLEGVVGKKAESVYKPGARSTLWLKVKTKVTQDLVIAGFTRPRGSRQYLGSLLLGMYKDGELVYAGHSGGSYGAESVRTIYEKLRPLVRSDCPFPEPPPPEPGVTWVEPALVCEVAFRGWTSDGVLRQPIFLRLRPDKEPREAVPETGTLRGREKP